MRFDRWICHLLLSVTFASFSVAGTSKRRIFFNLYTKRNLAFHQQLKFGRSMNVNNTNFDCTKPTIFLTHGWHNSPESESCTLLRDAYLKNIDGNVIVIDWSRITNQYYFISAGKVAIVGKYISRVINYLQRTVHLDVAKTTLVGHSLGAHVMGIAGYHTNGTIKTIFGLDPAAPEFTDASPGKRIGTHDAEYVQIIHTCGRFLGIMEPMGHSDFYPNGGQSQPGCSMDVMGLCSHGRSFEYLAESITPGPRFRASVCTNFSQMKDHHCTQTDAVMGGIAPTARGIYYLETNDASPYARG